MDAKKIFDIVEKHTMAEQVGDLDGVMATLGAHPVYDIYPTNVHVEGRDDVRKMYSGLLFTGLFDFDFIGSWADELSVVREYVCHVKLTEADQLHGLTFSSPKTFDLRTMSVFYIDVDTINDEEPLLKGERILFDGNVLFTQLGVRPQDLVT